jgi:hypothetical protein
LPEHVTIRDVLLFPPIESCRSLRTLRDVMISDVLLLSLIESCRSLAGGRESGRRSQRERTALGVPLTAVVMGSGDDDDSHDDEPGEDSEDTGVGSRTVITIYDGSSSVVSTKGTL